ncbi:MAG: alpha/beta hydrolase family protein [Actinomycetota bacterium]
MGKVATPSGDVSVTWDGPGDAPLVLVLAHGAGNDLHASFMAHMASGLAGSGIDVCRFNFLYSERGRRAPDRTAVLEETFRAVGEAARAARPGARLVIGGKSMGGRIASHLAAQGDEVEGLVFLGYPLHAPGRPENLRASHLKDIGAPMLFIEGTRDPFCPLETLEKVRADLSADSSLAVIDDGDHSFKVRKSSGRSTEEAWDEVVAAVTDWLRKI